MVCRETAPLLEMRLRWLRDFLHLSVKPSPEKAGWIWWLEYLVQGWGTSDSPYLQNTTGKACLMFLYPAREVLLVSRPACLLMFSTGRPNPKGRVAPSSFTV